METGYLVVMVTSTLSSLPITCFPKAIPQCICYTSTRFTSHQNMDAYTTQSLYLTLGGGLLNSSTCLMHLNGSLLLHQNTVLIWLHRMMGYIYTCMVRKKKERGYHTTNMLSKKPPAFLCTVTDMR